jgi:threonine/homoserine/homoserine lactone efflux protein
MFTFLGGALGLFLGIVGLVVWRDSFVVMLQGCVPTLFILGGALLAYMGYQEIKDKHRARKEAEKEPFAAASAQDETLERYRNEVQQLKDRLAALEKEKKQS